MRDEKGVIEGGILEIDLIRLCSIDAAKKEKKSKGTSRKGTITGLELCVGEGRRKKTKRGDER